MSKRIITEDKIIRVETNDGRTEDFPFEGDRYSGGKYNANQYIQDALDQELEPEIYIGTVVTDIERVDSV